MSQEQRELIEAERALKKKLLTPERFLLEVEAYSKRLDLDIIEAVTHFCQENEIDIEFAAKELMSDRLYALIQDEAEDKKLIKPDRKKLKFE